MGNDIVRFFAVQRSIFGLCPCCGELFRLSDSKVFPQNEAKEGLDGHFARQG